MRTIFSFVLQQSYVVLVIVLGSLGVYEGVRVGIKDTGPGYFSGPGGYLTIIGSSLVLFGLIDILTQVLRKEKNEKVEESVTVSESWTSNITWKPSEITPTNKMRYSYILCIVYVLLINPLGFTIASLVFLATNFWLLENKYRTIITTIVVMFFILRYGLPAMGLSVPKGIFRM